VVVVVVVRMRPAEAERAETPLVAAALEYVARGWAPIPIPAREKNPNRRGWQNERYTPETIPAAFGHAGGIGLLCGEPSGGLLDVDPDTAEGAAAWSFYRIPTDRSHSRQGGFQHDWFYGDIVPQQIEKLCDPSGQCLIELRSTGGQTVVPPSLHPTGAPLEWTAAGQPARVSTAALQRAVRCAGAAAMLARRWPDGARHDGALALAGMLLRGGMAQGDAERFVGVAARVAGDDEWQDRVRAVRDTAAAIAAGKPATGAPRLVEVLRDGDQVVGRLREWLELRDTVSVEDDSPPLDLWGSTLAGVPALDLSTLPPVIGEFAADVAARHGCDAALVALPALGVCAGAIDDRHQVQPRQHDTEWRVSARLWPIGIADVGGGKSPALREAIRPLREIDRRLAEEDRAPLQRHALAVRIYNRDIEKWIRGGGQGPQPSEPPRPPERRRVVEDVTTEALSAVLVDNPGGVLIAVDELSGLLGSFDAYRPAGVGKDQPLYLELYEGGPKQIDRVKRGKVFVPNWGASLVGGIQPERLRKLADRITDDGLLARGVPYMASAATDAEDRAPNRDALDRYTSTIRGLAALPATETVYTMTPEAHRRREYIARTARAVMVLPSTSSGLRAHLAKWEGLFARLALTWHLTNAAGHGLSPASVIDETTADCVARLLVDYLLPHSAHVYGEVLGQDHLLHARWIAGHILAHECQRITARDIGRAYNALRDDRRAIDESMATLVVAGWAWPIDGQPGRPAARWKINPRVHVLFARRAAAERERRELLRQQVREAAEALGMTGTEGE
jgi:hypothetical protein